MPFTEEDKRVIAWMNRMLGLRVFYVDEIPVVRQRRVREGAVTKVYDCLMIAELKLDDGTLLCGVHPSHVDVAHGIDGVHRGYFFPASGEWPS